MNNNHLIVGQINGVFGVQGWVKIFSHTDPRENIFRYSPWLIEVKGEWQEVKVEDFKIQQGGKALVAKLENIQDRDLARELMGCTIAIDRNLLEKEADDYFWVDLIGCEVKNLEGEHFGKVINLVETGAHDVLRIQGEDKSSELIPFVMGAFIKSVDIENKLIIVDWQADNEESDEVGEQSESF